MGVAERIEVFWSEGVASVGMVGMHRTSLSVLPAKRRLHPARPPAEPRVHRGEDRCGQPAEISRSGQTVSARLMVRLPCRGHHEVHVTDRRYSTGVDQ